MRTRILGSLLVLGLALTACAAPTKQYIAADGLGMYFALPVDWSHVPATQITKAQSGWTDDAGNVFLQTVKWQGAWTAGAANANQVYSASAPAKPVVFAFVRDLIAVEQQGVGSDITAALQDLVIPATSIVTAGGTVRTETRTASGLTGISQRATYASGGVLQTVEVVSMLAPGKDRVYSLVARCTKACYARNSAVVEAIFQSLTFKEHHGQ